MKEIKEIRMLFEKQLKIREKLLKNKNKANSETKNFAAGVLTALAWVLGAKIETDIPGKRINLAFPKTRGVKR